MESFDSGVLSWFLWSCQSASQRWYSSLPDLFVIPLFMSSCHPLNFHDGKKCSDVMFWLTRPIKPHQIGWYANHCEWHLKIFNNKQSPTIIFLLPIFTFIHRLVIETTPILDAIAIILTKIFTTNLSGRGTLPSWSVCDGSLSPCCSVSHWWRQGESQSFSWNYEMFVCYCCCKRVDDIMNLSNKLKLFWTAPQKFHLFH